MTELSTEQAFAALEAVQRHTTDPRIIEPLRLALVRLQELEAQPKPQGPTDEEILALSQFHGVSYTMSDGSVVYPMQEGTDMKDEVLSFTRAVLARWGQGQQKQGGSQ